MLLAEPVIGCYAVLCKPIDSSHYQLEDGVTHFIVTNIFTSPRSSKVFIQRNGNIHNNGDKYSQECFAIEHFLFYTNVNGNEKMLGVPNAKNNSM